MGPEIYEQTEGKVDIFVAGVGTGGTISGIGKYLKEKNPEVKVVAVEPASSPVLSTGKGGAHKIQGIGAGFVPETLDTKIYDEIITVENEDAFATGKEMAKTERLICLVKEIQDFMLIIPVEIIKTGFIIRTLEMHQMLSQVH